MGNIRRKTVIAGTIVAVLALGAGFALATLGGGLNQGTANSGLNTGSGSVPQGTIYAGTFNVAVDTGAALGSPITCTVGPYAVSGTDSVIESALTGGACNPNDIYVGVELTATYATGSESDSFAISLACTAPCTNTAPATADITIIANGYKSSESLTIWVDDGASGSANAATVSITVTGS